MTKKSLENEIFAKGNNSCKSRSNDQSQTWSVLCQDKIYPYSKFQVNISKDDWEKFGKPSGLTDWRTDGEETYIPPPPTPYYCSMAVLQLFKWYIL